MVIARVPPTALTLIPPLIVLAAVATFAGLYRALAIWRGLTGLRAGWGSGRRGGGRWRAALGASIAIGNPLGQRQVMARFGLSRAAERTVREAVRAGANGHVPE